MPEFELKAFLPNLEALSGKAALVTGGTTGIGKAVARVLVRCGVRVVTFGRNEDDLQAALAEVGSEGDELYGISAEVSRIEDVRRVFAEVDRRLGGLDILVNNAAVTSESIREDALEEIEYTVRTNIFGYLACIREAVDRISRRGGGHIVLIGSMSADLREPEGTTYVATKAAIQATAESLRKTVNKHGIKVSLVEPGKVATDLVEVGGGKGGCHRESADADPG